MTKKQMASEAKEQFIRQKAAEHIPDVNEKILWSFHAVSKLRMEGLRKSDVENCLRQCVLIEDYGETPGRPLPDCLVLEFADVGPVHAVVATDTESDRIIIITIYRPSQERWSNDWKRRKI